MTTTSSGAGAVEQWFSWWLADWGMDAQLTDLTQGLAAINLAGPRSREVLARVTDLDCSPEAFRYLDARAGARRRRRVPDPADRLHRRARLRDPLRRGARRAPLGRAAGRRRRAAVRARAPADPAPAEAAHHRRPGHRLGVDPVRAGMPWAVKLDKAEPFIGRWALEDGGRARARASGSSASSSTTACVPTEGAVVVSGDAPVGQVTSARRSPQLGRVIGMAWVPAERRPGRHGGDDLRRRPADRGAHRDRAVLRPRRARCCAREPRVPHASPPTACAVARSPMERQAAAAGRALRGARRLERGRRLRAARTPPPAAGPTSRTCARSSCTARPAPSSSSAPRRAAGAPGGAR